jgi:hypothetical protein
VSYDSSVRVAGLLLTLPLAGCAREPAEAICPELAAGDLAVTEVRGIQMPEDSAGPWVEIYNAGGRDIDLIGTKLRFRRKDGSSEVPVLVRRSLVAAPGSYTVLGLFDDTDPPPHVDYGFLGDYPGTWLAAAALDVEACGARIDRAIYDSLPRMGTFSLGGAPNADRNDFPASWCTDATQVGTSFPGTPGNPNIGCP